MAALSSKCLVLACEAEEGSEDSSDQNANANGTANGIASKILCHYFGSSDLNKEWSLEMPNQEEIMAVTCGEDWVSLSP